MATKKAVRAQGKEIPAEVTRGTLAEAVSALRAALPSASDKTLAKLLAQAMLETGNFASCYNFNWGNVRARDGEPFFMHPGAVDENIDGKHVVARGKDDPLRRFRAYASLEEGISEWLRVIRDLYVPGWTAANDDDVSCYQFAHALGEPRAKGYRYYTADRDRYAKGTASRYPAAIGAVTGVESWPTVRKGSEGPFVVEWQRILIAAGIPVSVDGIFGPETMSGTMIWQERKGLEVDGVVGPVSWSVGRG
jgi:peptidoglycan hydrolase-like protein with peptidoglycan-binding domain